MSDRQEFFRAVLRSDLAAFTEMCFDTLDPGTAYHDSWHVHAMAHALTRVWTGECKRLIINVPPRSMKSISVSVAFTAWVLGQAPSKRIMAVSYAADLARKHGADTRAILESSWFQQVFPACRIANARAAEIGTTQRGYRLAGSVTGSILGRGADLIVVDDPIKGLAAALSQAERRKVTEFYDNTLYSRLDNKMEGAIVIVMQRLHEDDLVGHVLAKEDWEVLSIPAIAVEDTSYALGGKRNRVYRRPAGEVLHPEREPMEILERIRRNLGSLNFSAQYQQNPMPADGNAIKRDWLRRFDQRPEAFDLVITSWDTASTVGESSDWSVGTVWGAVGQEYYLLDLVRGRWESPDLRRRIVALAREHRADATIIEDTELGRALVQDLRRTGELYPILQPARFDKEARLLAQAARFEAGQVKMPNDAPWLGAYLTELLAFPTGRHDDQVDATSQALRYLTLRTPVERPRPQGRVRPARVARRPRHDVAE